jgi:hypothetical protein
MSTRIVSPHSDRRGKETDLLTIRRLVPHHQSQILPALGTRLISASLDQSRCRSDQSRAGHDPTRQDRTRHSPDLTSSRPSPSHLHLSPFLRTLRSPLILAATISPPCPIRSVRYDVLSLLNPSPADHRQPPRPDQTELPRLFIRAVVRIKVLEQAAIARLSKS